MDNAKTAQVETPTTRAYKSLTIGRMWDNSDKAIGRQPKMRIVLDRNLGLNITLSPGSELVAFANESRREGKQDAQYRIAVNLPSEVADAEIARQKAVRASNAGAAVKV